MYFHTADLADDEKSRWFMGSVVVFAVFRC